MKILLSNLWNKETKSVKLKIMGDCQLWSWWIYFENNRPPLLNFRCLFMLPRHSENSLDMTNIYSFLIIFFLYVPSIKIFSLYNIASGNVRVMMFFFIYFYSSCIWKPSGVNIHLGVMHSAIDSWPPELIFFSPSYLFFIFDCLWRKLCF